MTEVTVLQLMKNLIHTVNCWRTINFSLIGSCAKGAKICSAPYLLVLQYVSKLSKYFVFYT